MITTKGMTTISLVIQIQFNLNTNKITSIEGYEIDISLHISTMKYTTTLILVGKYIYLSTDFNII